MKCRDCIWLDFSRKHSVGFECTNPNIKHERLGYLRQACSPACKRGFEGYDGQTIEIKPRRTYEQGRADERENILNLMDNIWNSTSCREKGFECWLKLRNRLKENKND